MRAPLHRCIRFFLIAVLTVSFCAHLVAQTPPPGTQAPSEDKTAAADHAPKDDPEVRHALELLDSGKMVESMTVFESLCNRFPKDGGMWEGWGVGTLAYAQTINDPETRRKARVRARSFLIKARDLGDNSNLLQTILPMIAEDGGDSAYSTKTEVNQIMQKAEANFARGDYEKARQGYLQALLLEPQNYGAALFIGDVYFKQHIDGSAGEWFARAIAIDPDRETAYRYWGDALWDMGKSADAREKYIQAIVADPYSQRSWMGLSQWAQRAKVNLNWVRLQDKSSVSAQDATHINITLDANSLKKDDPSGSAWMMYGMNRALWHNEKFKKEFPNEPAYRHTMREEVDSLHLMADVMREQKNFEKKKKDMDPALVQLVEIDKLGFLEPFALLNRADKEVAQDYAPYRDAHRETIYRYLNEYVVPKAPSQ